MKKTSKISLVMGLSLSPIAASAAATIGSCSQQPKLQEYHILAINDLHGAIPGYGEDVCVVDKANPGCFRLYKEVKKTIDKYPGSVFLSSGDENSGDSWTVCSHGQTTYPILKAMGVKYCSVGNHAFEWGYDDMNNGVYDRLGRTDETEGKYFVSSNIFNTPGYSYKDPDGNDWCVDETKTQFEKDFKFWNEHRVAWADPYKMLQFGDNNVCLIGLTTQQTIDDSRREVTQNMSFLPYDACIHYAKHLAKQELGTAKYNAIDSFILFTHCGGAYNDSKQQIEGEVEVLARTATSDFDAIMSAHTHKQFAGYISNEKSKKNIWISQAGTAARAFNDTKLVFNPTKPHGQRLESISMSLNKVPVPTDYETAKAEWADYRNGGGNMPALTKAYEFEREVVNRLMSPHLSQANLDAANRQKSDYEGYYNSVTTAISHITKQKVAPGHDYYMPEDILDHYGAWIARAIQLGFYHYFKDLVLPEDQLMPSCCFVSQDSSPVSLPNGEVCVRETYNMIPHDNKAVISYLNIFQLANVINYLLSGYTSDDQTKGFVYGANHDFEPDLNMYYGEYGDDKYEGFVVGSSTKQFTSKYLCGPLYWSGIKVKLEKIEDKTKTKPNHVDNTKSNPVFDETATYKVKTNLVTTNSGDKIYMPEIEVFEYQVDSVSKADNMKDLDTPPGAGETHGSWKNAEYWYNDGELKYIPVLTNNFIYGGGNGQFQLFKDYQEFNRTSNGNACPINWTLEWTCRDILEYFLKESLDEGFVWDGTTPPTNFSWTQAKKLIEK